MPPPKKKKKLEVGVETTRIVEDKEKLKKCWDKNITDIDDDTTEHIINAISESYSIYFAGLSDTEYLAYSKHILSHLADNGIISVLCNFLVHVIEEKRNATEQQNEPTVRNISEGIKCALGLLIEFTDKVVERSDIITDHPMYLSVIKTQLQRWHKLIEDVTASELKVIHKSVILIFNMTKNRENVEKMNALNFKDALVPYFNLVKDSELRLTSLAALANLVDEEQSEILYSDDEILKFLIKTLGEAFANRNHRKFGWSAAELAEVARRIAKNDENKRILVELGILHPLSSLAEKGNVTEQREAVKTIKTLSFDDKNRTTMIEDKHKPVVDIIVHLKKSSEDKKIRKTCERILWTMRENLAQSKNYQAIGHEFKREKDSAVTDQPTGHVMISYQWDNQEILKKVRDEIRKRNLNVWMDIDDMEGSILGSMAAAVENAAVVLICVSRRYKDSDNCRDEANYARELKKPIIPLIMEQGYKADGWLGITVAGKLYFKFSPQCDFHTEMAKLMKEIQRKLCRPEIDESDGKVMDLPEKRGILYTEITTLPKETTKEVHSIGEMKSWTPEKVNLWVENHGLPKRFQKLTGVEIAFLIVLKKEVTGDFFYKTLMDMLDVKDLATLSKLRFALDDTSTF